jgi:ribosome maturation factor RimP
MHGRAARDRVADLLAPVLAESRLDLEAVDLIPAGRRTLLRVVVDADGGVTVDQLAEISTTVANLLDASGAMGARPYTLEVTSRGVDRPLTEPRHWRRNIGRLVEVAQLDGSQLAGRIVASDDEGAELEADGRRSRVVYRDVAKALVQVEFGRPTGGRGGEGTDDRDEEG